MTSGRLVTDGVCQSVKIGLIRLIFVATKVRINGLTKITTVSSCHTYAEQCVGTILHQDKEFAIDFTYDMEKPLFR